MQPHGRIVRSLLAALVVGVGILIHPLRQATADHPLNHLLQESLTSSGGRAEVPNSLRLVAVVGQPIGGPVMSQTGWTLRAGFQPHLPALPPGTRAIVVEGATEGPAASLVVNGVASSLHGQAFHAERVWLFEGPNRIEATLTDRVQNRRTKAITVYLDTHPPSRPTVDDTPPVSPGARYTLTGTKVPGTSLWINGQPVESLNGQTTWSAQQVLVEGDNRFAVVTKDAAGNVSTAATVVLVLDEQAPIISDALAYLDEEGNPLRRHPTTGLLRTNFHSVTIRGRVDDHLTTVTVNDLPATRDGPGFEVTVPLTADTNVLHLKAVSPNRHVTDQDLQQIERGTIPTITAVQPADGMMIYVETQLPMTATAADKEGNPIQYQLWLDGRLLVDWTSPLSSVWTPARDQDGLHRLEVRVRDGFGGFASKLVEVFVLLRPVAP